MKRPIHRRRPTAIVIRFPRELVRAIFVEPVVPGDGWRWHIRRLDGESCGLLSETGDMRVAIDDAHCWSRKNGLPVIVQPLSGPGTLMRRRA